MEENLLNKVLEFESTLANRLKEEEGKIDQWLEERRQELVRKRDAEIKELDRHRQNDLDRAEQDGRRKAVAMIEEAEEIQQKLSALADASFQRIVAASLNRIRPKTRYDSQDVEG